MKVTSDRHEALHGLSVTVELLIVICDCILSRNHVCVVRKVLRYLAMIFLTAAVVWEKVTAVVELFTIDQPRYGDQIAAPCSARHAVGHRVSIAVPRTTVLT